MRKVRYGYGWDAVVKGAVLAYARGTLGMRSSRGALLAGFHRKRGAMRRVYAWDTVVKRMVLAGFQRGGEAR